MRNTAIQLLIFAAIFNGCGTGEITGYETEKEQAKVVQVDPKDNLRLKEPKKSISGKIVQPPDEFERMAEAERAAEYDLIKRLHKRAGEFRGATYGNVENYKDFAMIYVYRAREFKSDARGMALLYAQMMLFTGAGNLEIADEPRSAFELYALAEAVAAIANEVVQDKSHMNLIAKNNQNIGGLKQGLLTGRMRNIPRQLLQTVYDGNYKRVYRVYNHEEEPIRKR